MSDDAYIPTDNEVRSMFCIGISHPTNPEPVPARQAYDGYDRWLAARDRRVAARALWDAAEDWANDPDSVDCETPADTRNWMRDRADQIAGIA